MRFCPVCQTKYDEEIIKFCTKDGSPLVEDNPTFSAMPSQTSIDVSDSGEADEPTIIRRNRQTGELPSEEFILQETRPKIVIPTKDEPVEPPPVAAANPAVQAAPRKKSKTGLVVALTILGTLAILAGAGGVLWFLSDKPDNQTTVNINTNSSANTTETVANQNANLAVNVDANANTNLNANTNTNAPTPTPTKTPTPMPTKTPTPTPTPEPNLNLNINSQIPNNSNSIPPVNRFPSNTRPTPAPRPPATPPANQTVNVGIINSRAVSLPKPAYPPIAKQMRASGQVSVQVLVDEQGNVVSAKAISGHMLLRAPSEAAARQSRFNPVKIGNQPVRATGTIVYNYINQ